MSAGMSTSRIFITGGASGLGRALAERYAKAGWKVLIGDINEARTADTPDPVFSDVLVLDLSTVVPSVAGPKRPQDLVMLTDIRKNFATNLPSLMAFHASQLYSRNVTALILHLAPEGQLKLDFDDEITAGACVTRREEVPA